MPIKLSIKPFILILSLLVITGWYLGTAAHCDAATAKDQYLKGNRAFRQLQKHPEKLKYRDNWMKCIDKFQNIFLKMPDDSWAPAAMYRAAELYLELYKHSYVSHDKEEARDLFQRITRRYSWSAYRNKAIKQLAAIEHAPSPGVKNAAADKTASTSPPAIPSTAKDTNNQIPRKKAQKTKWFKKNIEKHAHTAGATSTSNRDAVITDIRHWSNPSYTRVVIDIEKDRKFTHTLLEKNPTLNKPKRLFLDIENSRLGKNLPKQTYINDHLLTQARAGQHTPHSVRVVIDIKSFDNYKVFSLNDPYRVVVDVWAQKDTPAATSVSQDPEKTLPPSKTSPTNGSLIQQLALGVKTIVIDPGHGGKDPGAPGYQAGVQEKTVVLKIAKKTGKKNEITVGLSGYHDQIHR